jgi:hypothetical protein
LAQSRIDYVVDGDGLELELHFAGIQTCHFAGFANQSIEAVALFGDDNQEILALRVAKPAVG